MAEPVEAENDVIHGVKMAATALTAAILTAAIVIGGGRSLAPSLFLSATSTVASAGDAVVVRISDR